MVFKPSSSHELFIAVFTWGNHRSGAMERYGEINTWDTSEVTDMSRLFANNSNFQYLDQMLMHIQTFLPYWLHWTHPSYQ